MYVQLEKDWIDKNTKRMLKNSKEEFPNDEEADKTLLDVNVEERYVEVELNLSENKIEVIYDTPLGYFSFDVPFDEDDKMAVVQHMKAKGEKIKELIKLADV